MITSTQLIILVVIGLIFLMIYIDRICSCIERTKNPVANLDKLMQFLKNVNGENGNKPL